VPEPNDLIFRWLLKNIKRYKSLGIDQIPAEFIKVGGRTIRAEIHKPINSIWNIEEVPQQWMVSVIVPTYKKGDKM
jgi:hypothetical protein